MYMLVGMLIGVLVFYFLVIPDIKDDYNEKLREMETSYSETISTKNNEIDNLHLEVEGLSSRNASYESKQAEMQTTIDNLSEEVETLKKAIESGGLVVSPDGGEGTDGINGTDGIEGADGTQANGEGTADGAGDDEMTPEEQAAAANAAAERNNANVIGISGNSIEDMITNE